MTKGVKVTKKMVKAVVKAKAAKTQKQKKKGRSSRAPKVNGGWAHAVVPTGGARAGVRVARNAGAMMQCCRMVNPFDARCGGCKIPDG